MKHRLIAITISCFAAIVFFGCAASEQMYYWGDYSDSLYDAKKTPGAESLLKHKEALENIYEESQKRNLRVPPGVCAELGYLYALQNNISKAVLLFQTEKQTYPEAAVLMDRMIQQAKLRVSHDGAAKEMPQPPEDLINQEKNIGGDPR